jgi:hypothetical protein
MYRSRAIFHFKSTKVPEFVTVWSKTVVHETHVVTTQSPRECVPLLPKRPFAVLGLCAAVPIPDITKNWVFIVRRKKPPKPLTEKKKFVPR